MSDPICTLEQGQVKGKIEKDMDGNPFLSFMGIPYAKPPLDKLRFKPPQPADKWQGIYDATKEPNNCYSLQVELTGFVIPHNHTLQCLTADLVSTGKTQGL